MLCFRFAKKIEIKLTYDKYIQNYQYTIQILNIKANYHKLPESKNGTYP